MSDRVLLFDLGGVLVASDMFGELKRLMRTDLTAAELVERWLANPAARRFELGQSTPLEFAHEIVGEFGLELEPAAFIDAFSGWPKGFASGALELLSSLRRRYRIACLSNSNELHWGAALTAPFDEAFSSHLIGRIKPDREAFEYAIDSLGCAPREVTYFDDAVSNVRAAAALGVDAHHTDGFEALRRRLDALGLVEGA